MKKSKTWYPIEQNVRKAVLWSLLENWIQNFECVYKSKACCSLIVWNDIRLNRTINLVDSQVHAARFAHIFFRAARYLMVRSFFICTPINELCNIQMLTHLLAYISLWRHPEHHYALQYHQRWQNLGPVTALSPNLSD